MFAPSPGTTSQSRIHRKVVQTFEADFLYELEEGRESTRPRVMISSPGDEISAGETPGDHTSSRHFAPGQVYLMRQKSSCAK